MMKCLCILLSYKTKARGIWIVGAAMLYIWKQSLCTLGSQNHVFLLSTKEVVTAKHVFLVPFVYMDSNNTISSVLLQFLCYAHGFSITCPVLWNNLGCRGAEEAFSLTVGCTKRQQWLNN